MKRLVLFAIFLAAAAALAGCATSESSSDAPAPAGTSNTSQPVRLKDAQAAQTIIEPPAASASTPTPGGPPPALLGTYTISEVQHKDMVTIIRSQNATDITFLADGSFTRVSRKGGKTDYTDSGNFRFEGNDQLVLNIQLARSKIVMPPVEKRHKISVSADGSELRMEGADGKVAVFRRTREIAGQ